MLHRDRVSFTRVGADEQNRLAVLHIIERVGHRTVTPGVSNTCHGGGVTNSRLVIGIIGAPHGGQLAHQVRLLVIKLGRAKPVNTVWAIGVTQFKQLIAYFINRIVPAQPLPFTRH